jgi:hypothetical protein
VAIVKPMTPEHRICNLVYLTFSLFEYILCYLGTEKSVYIAHIILSIRTYVRLIDFENTKDLYDPVGNWYFLCATKLVGTYANLMIMFNNFELSRFRIFIIVLNILVGGSTILIGIYDLDYLASANVVGFLLQFLMVYAMGVFQIFVHRNITREITESMVGRIEEQSKFE